METAPNICYCGFDEFNILSSCDINLKPVPIRVKSVFEEILYKNNIQLVIYRKSFDSLSWYAQGYGVSNSESNEPEIEIFSSNLQITHVTESPNGLIGLSKLSNCFYQSEYVFDEKNCRFKFNLQEIKVTQIRKENNFDDLAEDDLSLHASSPETEVEHDSSKFIHLASTTTEVFAIDETTSIYNVLDNKFVWKLPTGKISKLVSGFSHNLLLTDTGAVYAWGNGSRGQLGQDVIILSAPTPRRIEFFDDLPCIVSDIAAGGWHSLALTSDGDVYSWGWNESSQLGHSSERISSVQCIPYPVDLGSLSNPVVAIAAGSRHSAVLMKNGLVYTWGFNKFGQLGLDDTNNRTDPAQVDLIELNTRNGHPPRRIICVRWGTFIIY